MRKSNLSPRKYRVFPTRVVERGLFMQGFQRVAGVDEVGRGSLAGPVVAAAVILPYRLKASWVKEVRDSKLLQAAKREALGEEILKVALGVGIGEVAPEFIDSCGIAPATRLAMKIAIENLQVKAQFIMVDALRLPEVHIPQQAIIKGDRHCFIISCASIIAKTYRDGLMKRLSLTYPGYYLEKHKGYGTSLHLRCLENLGPSKIHRISFYPVSNAMCKRKADVLSGDNSRGLMSNNPAAEIRDV